MNGLRKPRPSQPSPMLAPSANVSDTTVMSRTMQLAVSGMKVSMPSRSDDSSNSAFADLQRRGSWFAAPAAAAPRTKVERYWATRAVVAETLLSARGRHQGELAEMRRIEEQKHAREVGIILHASDERQRRFERLMVMCLAVLLGLMCWLVMMIASDRAKSKLSGTSHFTIPILSPFASVVEHETGVFNVKVVAIFSLAVGIALYAALRHRLSQWYTQ